MMQYQIRELTQFVLITFSLAIIYSIVWYLDVLPDFVIPFYRIVAMLIPTMGVLTMTLMFRSKIKDIGWGRFPLKWLLPALFLLPVVIHVVNLPLVAFLNEMVIPWKDWLISDNDGIYYTPESRGWGDLTTDQLIKRISINALIGVIIVSFLAFFEEVGWRSWMLPRLIKKHNVKNGILFSAAIWALWHLPLVLGGINRIPGIPLTPMLLLYPLGLLGAGIVIGWLWYRSKSIWIVCLAHGAFNNWGQYAFKYMKGGPNPDEWPWLYTGVNGALLLVGIIVIINLNSVQQITKQPHHDDQ